MIIGTNAVHEQDSRAAASPCIAGLPLFLFVILVVIIATFTALLALAGIRWCNRFLLRTPCAPSSMYIREGRRCGGRFDGFEPSRLVARSSAAASGSMNEGSNSLDVELDNHTEANGPNLRANINGAKR
jgi:hypothetical protein